MSLIIRPETAADFPRVHSLIRAAFATEPHSNHDEQDLVDRLRAGGAYVPQLALVAESDGELVGHILLSRSRIVGNETAAETLTLAPLAVAPDHQRRGIGGRLIGEAHTRAAALGFGSIVLVGHPAYYPRFGYRPAASYGIRTHLDLPEEVFMVCELTPNSLAGVSGTIVFAPEFGLGAIEPSKVP